MKAFPTYRCSECSLMRCFGAHQQCQECQPQAHLGEAIAKAIFARPSASGMTWKFCSKCFHLWEDGHQC